MSAVNDIEKLYRKGRYYEPETGGSYPIVDWILIEEAEGWVKGAELIRFERSRTRIRFIYWRLGEKGWEISRMHPLMNTEVAKELFAKILLKNWI